MKIPIGSVVVLCALAGAANADLVWDTGGPTVVNFNGADTLLGYSSGNVSAATPQRWAAQAFTMPAGYNTITQIDADWFNPGGGVNGATVQFRIFQRNNMVDAPSIEVASGTLGAYADGIDDPRVAGADIYLHQYTGLNIALGSGDYWLSIYADGLGAGNTTGFSNLAWMAGAAGVDSSVTYNNFMWRSSAFPSPGFELYAPANILPGAGMTDATDRWNTSFAIHAIPAPSAVALLGLGSVAGLRRRR